MLFVRNNFFIRGVPPTRLKLNVIYDSTLGNKNMFDKRLTIIKPYHITHSVIILQEMFVNYVLVALNLIFVQLDTPTYVTIVCVTLSGLLMQFLRSFKILNV
jgi:uncharacterized integral membrane protein